MQELTFEQVDVVSGGTFWDIQEVQKELEYREQVMEQGGGGINVTSAFCVVAGPITTCLQSDGNITSSICVGPSTTVGGMGAGYEFCVITSTPAAPASPTPGSVGDYWGVQ